MQILINVCTHGDEQIGLQVVERLKQLDVLTSSTTVLVANEAALKADVRFIETDLNRSFPGDPGGSLEEQLAHSLRPTISAADVVLDIHSTKSDLKDAIIVTKLTPKTLEYIQVIGPRNLIFMNIGTGTALISQAKIGIAFEYGQDTEESAIAGTVLGIERLMKYLNSATEEVTQKFDTMNIYEVYSDAKRPEGYTILPSVQNYVRVEEGEPYATNGSEVIIAEEAFYPILFGEKTYKTYFGFKAHKLSLEEVNIILQPDAEEHLTEK